MHFKSSFFFRHALSTYNAWPSLQAGLSRLWLDPSNRRTRALTKQGTHNKFRIVFCDLSNNMPSAIRPEKLQALEAGNVNPNSGVKQGVLLHSMSISLRLGCKNCGPLPFYGQVFYVDIINSSPTYIDDRRAEIKALAGLKPSCPKATYYVC